MASDFSDWEILNLIIVGMIPRTKWWQNSLVVPKMVTSIWLVVWNIFYFWIYWEFHHSNWRTHIFQRGGYTGPPTSYSSDTKWDFLLPSLQQTWLKGSRTGGSSPFSGVAGFFSPHFLRAFHNGKSPSFVSWMMTGGSTMTKPETSIYGIIDDQKVIFLCDCWWVIGEWE